jgi:hypothetical protein
MGLSAVVAAEIARLAPKNETLAVAAAQHEVPLNASPPVRNI